MKPGASPQEFEIGRNERSKRASIGRSAATRVRGETRLQRWGSLMAMNLGRCPRLLLNVAPLALSALSRSAAADRQRRKSDRNRELAELR